MRDLTYDRVEYFLSNLNYSAVDQRNWWHAGNRVDAVAYQAACVLTGHRRMYSQSQYKLDKAEAQIGYLTRGLSMSPAHEAAEFLTRHGGKFSMCGGASPACVRACVGTEAGQTVYTGSKIARIGRTIAYYYNSSWFFDALESQISRDVKGAARKGLLLAFRANISTDRPGIASRIQRQFPSVKVYDYTALTAAMEMSDGVQRVYSLKEGADRRQTALDMLSRGHGVAVVFAIPSRSKGPLPTTWHGYPVQDGDVHDLFWHTARDTRRRAYGTADRGGYVVGLRVKGRGARDAIERGFAVPV